MTHYKDFLTIIIFINDSIVGNLHGITPDEYKLK